jgi:hypothetical protein
MNYNQAMAAARTGQLISINGHVLALLEGAQLTHEELDGPLTLRTMLFALTDKAAIPFTPSVLDKESQDWQVADKRDTEADEEVAFEGRAILTLKDEPRFVEIAVQQLNHSKKVKIESMRHVGDGAVEIFLLGKELPVPVAGQPTEKVIMVVEQATSGDITQAFLSGREQRYVL